MKRITISDYEYRISQFADDTVIFLKDKSIVKKSSEYYFSFFWSTGSP